MSNFSYPSAEPAPHASDVPAESRPRSFFALLISALHRSRSLQARRFLHQYQHLLERYPPQRISLELNLSPDGREIPVADSPDRAKRAAQRSEIGWLAAVALAFLIIHIVAGSIWLRASANQAAASERQATFSSYD